MDRHPFEREINALKVEMRGIKSQNLSTDAGLVIANTKATGSISGVPANDGQFRNYKVKITFTPSDTSVQPMTNIWLSNVHVPTNDFGFDDSALLPVQTSPSTYEVICPFIGINISDTYSFGVTITSLVKGTVKLERSVA